MNKILIVHHGQGLGGGLVALLGLIDDLKKSNYVEVLCLFESDAVKYIKTMDVKVFIASCKFYKSYYQVFVHSEADYFDVFQSVRKFKNLMTFFLSKYYFANLELSKIQNNYDILYLNSTFISDFAFTGNQLKKKVIIHVREPLAKGLFGIRKAIIKNEIKRYCNKIFAISNDNAIRVGLESKTKVIYDPVVTKNRKNVIPIVVDISKKHFLYLGGYQRIKGFQQLVECLPFLEKDIRIFFAGGDPNTNCGILKKIILFFSPYNRQFPRLVKKINESKNIIKIGSVDHVFNFLDVSLAMIVPFSKPHAALPILEAFSQAKPVIVSDIVGMDEIVNNANGTFFKNGREQLLAEKINNFAKLTPDEYNKIKLSALETYVELQKKNQQIIVNEMNFSNLLNS